MEMRNLGHSGLQVSSICLGTMTWGQQNTESEGHAQMDMALDNGVNFFDTAELYPIPPQAKTQGRTEKIIGNWFAARNNRDKIILATKVVGRSRMDWFRDNGTGCELSREQIMEAVDKSLARLQTDYIDLYQLHWPDRPVTKFGSNPVIYRQKQGDEHAIEETLGVLDDLIRAGKIRHAGISNESAWGTMSWLAASKENGLPRVQSIQNAYSLVNRTFETALAEISGREDIGLLAYSPLAQGYLSGKYENGALPAGSRKALFNLLDRYETPGAPNAISAYISLARRLGLDPVQMAIQFVTTRPFTTSTIIGATSLEQLKTALDSVHLSMDEELEDHIDAIHLQHTNPCP